MSNDQARRIDDALSSLVDAFLPALPGEDEELDDERRDAAFDNAKDILNSQSDAPASSDVNQAADLIKKKFIRDHSSPDRALRFSNLYARLLTQPVLSQKWAILYLLHQLADDGPERSQFGHQLREPSRPASQWGGTVNSSPPRTEVSGRSNTIRGNGETRYSTPESTPYLGSHRRLAPRGRERIHPARRPEPEDRMSYSGDDEEGRARVSPPAEDVSARRPTEAAILRDLPFTLQGLSSTNLQFDQNSSLTLPSTLPLPMISLLHTLAEPSLLYRELSAFVQSSDGGLIGQSLRAAIETELHSYLGLVATLEGQIRRALTMIDENERRNGLGKAGMTLKKCVLATRDATMNLRLMMVMVEESKTKKGGQVISLIHGFSSSHGDPYVGAFAEKLLVYVTRPFYDMLRQWIYDGELSDPYSEFFISKQRPRSTAEVSTDGRSRGGATSVWEDKYKLDDEMIPTIITKDFAQKVFLIGKSLNFIRYGCGDAAWVEKYSKEASRELKYGDTALLDASIDEAYNRTMARLMDLMANKFKLLEHLKALKKYLLLGQGDFIALLMESLSSSLDRPANTLFRHSLTAQLEHAIRGSNAQFDPADVLRRLDARMLMQGHGDIGWECFTLEYKVEAPIDVIVTAEGSREYLKVFNFLWRIKRVEFALGSTWRRAMTGARGVLVSVTDKVGEDWKVARCCIAEMIHFIGQLQYYILFEVIQSSWDELEAAVSKADATLDDLIEAHARYLQAITHKGLLGSARSSHAASKGEFFLTQLHEILKTMLAYKDAVDGLYSFSIAEFTRRQEFNARLETRGGGARIGQSSGRKEADDDSDDLRPLTPLTATSSDTPQATSEKPGPGPGPGPPPPPPPALLGSSVENEDHMLPSIRQSLKTLSGDFRARLNILLGDLAYQQDVDMRFLGVVMNFNDVYHPVRRKSRREVQQQQQPPQKAKK